MNGWTHSALLLCVLFLLWPVGSASAESPNALTNGSFESEGATEGARGWSRGDPAFVRFITEDGNRFCRIDLAERGTAIIAQTIDLPAGTMSLDIRAKMRVKDLARGDQPWQTGMVQYLFLDADGQRVGGWPRLMPGGTLASWTTLEERGETLPAGAVKLRVQCGVWNASGAFDFDDVEVVVYEAGSPGPGERQSFEQPEIVTLSPTRASMMLNGNWKYMAASGAAAKSPTGQWLVRSVPDEGGSDSRMWYERTFTVPSGWSDRDLVLDIERVSTDATVYVNGQEAGLVRWPGGQVDVTDLVRPGAENELRLLVVAVDDLTQVTKFMGYLNEQTAEAKLEHRGIIGDVTLESRPSGGRVADLLVQPLVREQRIGIDVELSNVPRAGLLLFEAEMLDEQGEVEKTFTAELPSEAGDSLVSLSFDWADPRLWDVGQPNLYTLRLTVSGLGVEDVYVQRFGFREFWIEGRKFFLNGSEIRLRPTKKSNSNPGLDDLARLLDQGFNFVEMWPSDFTRRGSLDRVRDLPDAADEAGMLVAANVAHMNRVVRNWDDAALREQWQRIMEDEVRTYRKHPSVVMYAHSGNALPIWSDSNPWLLGQEGSSVVQEQRLRRERVLELIGQIKALHPQPVFAHHGGDNGDVHTSNMYLNFIPRQERVEWISYWAKHGDIPWMACEFGLPHYSTVMRGRAGYFHQVHSEPLLTEWAAAHLGSEAYAIEPDAYRNEVIVGRYEGVDPQKAYEPSIRWHSREQIIVQSPAFRRLLEIYVPRTFRSFRAMGLTGGLVPWSFDDVADIVTPVNGPALAFIAGPGDIPDQQVNDQQPLTDRTHHYTAGEQLAKQVILINDHRSPVPFIATWTVELEGRELASRTINGELAVAEIDKLPIIVELPDNVTGVGKVEGLVTLRASVGDTNFDDVFAFSVWPPSSAHPAIGITLSAFDPIGDTTRWLESVGVQVEPWTNGEPSHNVAVVGRDALSAGHQLPGDLEKFVAGGGRLIVFAQDPQWIEHALHLRVIPNQALRQTFVAQSDHPVLAGLDAEALSYWNGSSTAIVGYPRYPNWEWTPKYGWRWGNRHVISSAVIEKPHRSSWTPIVEQGFDLAYTSLMEMRYGQGLVVLNTLDVEARTRTDPAAVRLTRQLVRYVADVENATPIAKVAYLGGDAGRQTLDQLGVEYQTVASPDPSIGLLIVGGDVSDDPAIHRYLNDGGRAVFLRRGSDSAPMGVRLVKDDQFLGSIDHPKLPEARGLTASDLRYRAPSPAWVLAGGPGLTIDASGQLGRLEVGQGLAVYAQLGPDAVPADQKQYLRYTRWRQTRALSQVLATMGATFQQDRRFIELLKTPDHYIPLAGEWKFKAVNTLPESPDRKWNNPQPISDEARALVGIDPPSTRWIDVTVPGYVEGYGSELQWIDGEFVYRKTVQWPAYASGRPTILSVGRVDKVETSFINGTQVGHSQSWRQSRSHAVKADLVKAGQNVVAIRVWDEGVHGGMVGNPLHLYLKVDGKDAGFYHPDYLDDHHEPGGNEARWRAEDDRWKIADDPYRYYRW